MAQPLKNIDELQNTYVDDRVKNLIPKFEELAIYSPRTREYGKNGVKGWKSLATEEAVLLKRTYPDDSPENERTYATCLRQVSALKKGLKKGIRPNLRDSGSYYPVETIVRHFGEALSYQFAQYKFLANVKYRQKVAYRSQEENRIEIDLSKYLTDSRSIFQKVTDGATLKDLTWQDVSIAIALTTGRRMAEVHLSGEFRVISEYEIGFKGQLKGKDSVVYLDSNELPQRCSRDDFETLLSRNLIPQQKAIPLREYEFKIPTLVKSLMIVNGLVWLEENGKRFPRNEDPERVNRRWSKVLNERVKLWNFFGAEGMTYHKTRAGYVPCVVKSLGIKPVDYVRGLRWIIGDDDQKTIESYQRFDVKEGSITRL